MTGLLRVELTRLRWRRAVLVLVGAAVLVPLVILGVRTYDTRPVGDGDRAAAQQQVDVELEYIEQGIADCEQNPRNFGVDPDRAERQCARQFGYQPQVEDYLYREQLNVARERSNSALAVVAIVAALMLLAGTTYVGHDWNSGSMSNQLLFEPRRLRVWLAKAVAVALVAASVAVVGLVLFWGGLLLVAQSRDLPVPGQVVTDVVQHALRSTLAITGAAVFGYALTTLSRSTVFTIGVLFAVSVAGGLIFALLPQSALRYEPSTNAAAVVNGRAEYWVQPPEACYGPRVPDGLDCDETKEVSVQHGTAYYAVLMLLVGGASAASFRRRDIS
ncbi:ABC transporter permease subunit [Nocardioides dongxiaopingii]|uniref:ABC transporter permease subunit n=1 Tax=Nocardioides sp. S-1144 TaxID=2582905 RepID=UPI00110E89AD|nr:ABC transporter permease subunit [Nocardioides sp. S-1144]QCW51099.1 ABC transporter permease subunit [Nocardioides sp. S-1144]